MKSQRLFHSSDTVLLSYLPCFRRLIHKQSLKNKFSILTRNQFNRWLNFLFSFSPKPPWTLLVTALFIILIEVHSVHENNFLKNIVQSLFLDSFYLLLQLVKVIMIIIVNKNETPGRNELQINFFIFMIILLLKYILIWEFLNTQNMRDFTLTKYI